MRNVMRQQRDLRTGFCRSRLPNKVTCPEKKERPPGIGGPAKPLLVYRNFSHRNRQVLAPLRMPLFAHRPCGIETVTQTYETGRAIKSVLPRSRSDGAPRYRLHGVPGSAEQLKIGGQIKCKIRILSRQFCQPGEKKTLALYQVSDIDPDLTHAARISIFILSKLVCGTFIAGEVLMHARPPAVAHNRPDVCPRGWARVVSKARQRRRATVARSTWSARAAADMLPCRARPRKNRRSSQSGFVQICSTTAQQYRFIRIEIDGMIAENLTT